ncbi:MAG: TaqI-like C-terminal specificity domain-containing protein [Candidatus Celaenobacter polaris]|nr:TaqI-like C-terminal specificity domain-containing protein [Candidatus Celaenobacter polaris]
MSLFQKVIVKKYLQNLPSDLIEENYKKYTNYFNDFARAERIRALKEEQYQEGFLRELFVECLNYTINPDENFNLTTEFKNKTDAEKADGAILKDGKPIAVIELKSTKTLDLKTIEKQAFNYKSHQTNCKYVITSNFEKIRLYINDATEFEEFNVFQLSKNDFKFLYLCFSKDSIFEDIPAEIKEKSNQHEEQISKKLYNDYSVFRNSIFQNLTKNNPQIDELLLFKKSQKLLDRFLFIFFAEDKGLIPPNIISKIIDDYNKLKDLDVYTPLYTIFKKYFSYINKGYEKLSIDAYNGGLFQFDEILDNVEIDDEILITDSLKLSNYDFDSEIDVNILGHIFEHSLTDIEKLNAEILAAKGHTPLLDKKQTRRKKEGVFYTPNYITKYIVENTVGTLCSEKKTELELDNIAVDESYFKKAKKTNSALSKKGKQLYDKLENYKEWLLSLKILDPACGSGAFLNQALNFLIDEHNFIIDLETDLRKGQLVVFDIDTAVLENNLYGVDINEESVEIAQLSLWLKTAKRGRKLTDLSKNIKCGNSLIDDPEIAGEKAFDWNKEFPEIMQNGGFDVVIGNPPYGAKISKNDIKFLLSKQERHGLSNILSDTYIAFYIQSLEKLLKQSGLLGFITPNTWRLVQSGDKFRNFLSNGNYSFQEIVQHQQQVFADATVDCDTVIIQKQKLTNNILNIEIRNNFDTVLSHSISQNIVTKQEYFNLFLTENAYNLKQKIENKSVFVKDSLIIKNGVKPYEKGKGKPPQTSETMREKPFTSVSKIDETFSPLIGGSSFNRYKLLWNNDYWIKYGQWLAAPRDSEIFQAHEKLIFRQTGDSIIGNFVDNKFIMRNNTHILLPKNNNFNLKYVLSVLNSKLSNFIYWTINPEKGEALAEVKAFHLGLLCFPKINTESQQPFIEKADLMLSLNKQKQEKINKFLHRLETSFEIENFSNKMKAFYDYDFKTLISEFKKKKIKLTFSQQDEFEEYFNNYKEEILKLQKQINQTDKEIDQMVYELYGLTDEEIEVVENAGE